MDDLTTNVRDEAQNPAFLVGVVMPSCFFQTQLNKMKKSKEHASELLVVYADAIMQENWKLFTEKLSNVFLEVAVNEVQEMRKARSISTDNGLIPIYKDQRLKYASICKIINVVKPDLLSITDFDEVIKEVHPKIYDWYVSTVLE